MTIQQAFEQAVQHHQAGRLDQAEQIYKQILAQQPKNIQATHMLGVIAFQSARYDMALQLLHQVIAAKPDFAPAYNVLGMVYSAQRHLDQALATYRQLIAINPNFADAYNNLGNVLSQQGHLDQAIDAYRQAIAVQPALAEAHNNLGIALSAQGQVDEAIAAYRQAIALQPKYADAYVNLGNILWDRERVDEAIAAYHQAITFNPNIARAYNNLGAALQKKGTLGLAIAACQRAIELKPDYPEAYCNLGSALWDEEQVEDALVAFRQAIALNPVLAEAHNGVGLALRSKGQLDEAIAACRLSIAFKPGYCEAYNNLANILSDKGQLDEAIATYRQAIGIKPTFADAHHNLALALLSTGDLAQGWEEYEWRWQYKYFTTRARAFAQNLWDGSPLQGRTILLHAEQGFGDTIQFIRYLPMVRQRGGQPLVECQPELQRLLQGMGPEFRVVVRGSALPEFDVHCPLMSLPRVMGTTLENIPHDVPYLQAESKEIERWKSRFADDSLKVGLAWAGRPTHKNDRHRSIPLSALVSLAQVPGVRLYSLQKHRREQAPPPGLDLIDWTAELNDFADTAALIANLDLVISADTAVVHLAGAMGKPVWTLLPFGPDWRWMLAREDSPWYPTMRLFRQPSIGDWDSVLRRATQALADFAQQTGKDNTETP